MVVDMSAPHTHDAVRKLERLFLDNPGRWFDMHDLAKIAGIGGWRTRLSEWTRQSGIQLEKRQYVVRDAAGEKRYRVSERRYVPAAKTEAAA
jgi:hypothetical protein